MVSNMLRAVAAGALMIAGVALAGAAHAPKAASAKKFDTVARAALDAMQKKAEELKIGGVAVVNYAPGETLAGWDSRMRVVGRRKDEPTATSKGNNLIGIAYAKAAEMADTLKDSGTSGRAPMTGEFGWQGGVVDRGKSGTLIVAFSGGKSEDDVQVSRAGMAVLKGAL